MAKEQGGTAVSIVVLTYRGREQLDCCLRSLQDAVRQTDDVVVTEDGEDDETATIVAGYRSALPIRHVRHPDEGLRQSTARNNGLRATRGDLVIFLDHDIVVPPTLVDRVVDEIRRGWFLGFRRVMLDEALTQRVISARHPGVEAFSLAVKWHVLSRRLAGWRYLLPLRNRGCSGSAQTWRGMASFGFAAFRSDLLAVDGFDSRYDHTHFAEDWDVFARLEHSGVRPAYASGRATVAHLHHKHQQHDLGSKNYDMLEEVLRVRAVTAQRGLSWVS